MTDKPAIPPHQQRVLDECSELSERAAKLDLFIGGEVFRSIPSAEQRRLKRQLAIMNLYCDVLNERIENF